MAAYSVLMSVYAKEDPENLKEAMNSMFAQSIPPSDFVLVCDGPLTSALDRVIASFKSKYRDLLNVVRLKKNYGLGMALRKGLCVCKYELVARMDSDDISTDRRMELLLSEMEGAPKLAAVGGQIAEFKSSINNIVSIRQVPLKDQDVKEQMKRRNPMNHVTVLLRKSLVIRAGNYYELKGFEDYYLWARLAACGYQLKNIDAICCYVRINEEMYKRRGGRQYLQSIVRMERYLMNTGFINSCQYAENIAVRFCAAIMPNWMRKYLYNHFLRDTEYKEN